MTPKEAVKKIFAEFPFDDYLPANDCAHIHIAKVVEKYLKRGSKILDFGSGPCDKTAVLQCMGYQCHAFDDLNDDWHRKNGNREKILGFAENLGIVYHEPKGDDFPFNNEKFDMIMLHDVIEHLHESPKELLTKLLSRLNKGGYLFITVPNAVNARKRLFVIMGKTNYPPFDSFFNYPGPWRGHVREYVKNDLEQLCALLGLKKIILSGCDHMLDKVPRAVQSLYCGITSMFDSVKDSLVLLAKK